MTISTKFTAASVLFCCLLLPALSAPVRADNYSTSYSYDEVGRPLSIHSGSASADFAYDAAGNRAVVTISPGSTAPSVAVVYPAAGATGVSAQATVAVTFSRPVDPATVTTGAAGSFYLTGPGSTVVAGSVSVEDLEAVFVPSAPLAFNTGYQATVTTAVKDLAGHALTQQKVWSFTTGQVTDVTLPTVLSTTPLAGASNVSVSGTVSAVFSEPMLATTIGTDTFLLKNGTASITGQVGYNAATRTATLTPDAPLDAGTTYNAVILSSVTDSAGNRMAANQQWSFTTASGGTSVPPTATSLTPYDTQGDVPVGSAVWAIFDKSMNASTITGSTFTLTSASGPVTGSVSYNPVKYQATFIPSAPLAHGTVYTATLSTGIKDAVGDLLAKTTWTFTTVSLPPFLLTCNLSGAGAGTVDSTPAGFACDSVSCSGNFAQNSSVTLHPAPDSGTSVFAGWGAPCTGTGDCTFSISGNTTVAASFNLMPARIPGAVPQYFLSLQNAYNAAADLGTIQAQGAAFTGNLTLSNPNRVAINGGYDLAYSTNAGYSSMVGQLVVRQGKVTVNRLKVR